MKAYFFLVSSMVILFVGCKKTTDDDDPAPGTGGLNVYLAGNDLSADGARPCFWKNGTTTILANTSGGDGNSLYIDGSNVYVGGRNWLNSAQTRYAPCYWLNGNRTDLQLLDPRGDGMVNSIFAFNGTIYAAGTCTDSLEFFANSGWRYLPVYWKNGSVIQLERLNGFGGGFAEAIGLKAAPNRVITIIVGSSYAQSGYDEPCYWSIDPNVITTPGHEYDPTALSNKGFGGSAENLTISQSDVYIVGYVDNADGYNDPCYWKNGDRTDLSKLAALGQGVAFGADFSDNNIYVAGFTSKSTGGSVPCVWKNNSRTDLALPANVSGGRATSVRVRNGDVYVAGTISSSAGEYPCYWKNGEIVQHSTRGAVKSISLSDK